LRRPGAYEQIHATGRELMSTLGQLLREAGIAAQVIGEPPLFEVVFTTHPSPIRDYQGTTRGDMNMARRFNALLRERGILKGEQKSYVSLAHNADDIRHTRKAWASAIKMLVQ
jgi:glutamate-1-semialdehyde 2,1-aminomutase